MHKNNKLNSAGINEHLIRNSFREEGNNEINKNISAIKMGGYKI